MSVDLTSVFILAVIILIFCLFVKQLYIKPKKHNDVAYILFLIILIIAASYGVLVIIGVIWIGYIVAAMVSGLFAGGMLLIFGWILIVIAILAVAFVIVPLRTLKGVLKNKEESEKKAL